MTLPVALPATITRREIRGLLREELRGFALANIQRNRSIFHSAEQLAGTS
uniref:Acyl-CoA synthetase n=1 Tax=Angiostrongylus cantonensis TaxID=6313 RepID=A0A0K0CTQ8_ANGCA